MNAHPIPAVGVFILDGNGIYLIKKGRGIFQNQWCTPGGKIELGETIIETAHREVLEETSLRINDLTFITYEEAVEYSIDGTISNHFVFFNFKAKVSDGIPVAADDATEIRLIPFDELSQYDISAPTIRTLKLLNIL